MVTIGTDGNIDYVETPDGVRYALGTTSVLQVVSKLVKGQRHRREALDLFNKQGEAGVLLDVDAMFAMLIPKRARWAATDPLIPDANRDAPLRGDPMNPTFEQVKMRLAHIEKQVETLSKGPNPEVLGNLQKAVASISLPHPGDQGKNDAWYITAPPKVDTVEDPGAYTPPADVTHPLGKTASFLALQGNMKMAEEILQHVAETDEKIDALVTAGRKFNASKARADLHGVVATLTNMMTQVDMAQPWVSDDLSKIAKRCDELHALFASAKV